MSRDNEMPMYSINDVLDILSSHDSDEAYDAMSELTGISVDALYEMLDKREKKEKMVTVSCQVRVCRNSIVTLSEKNYEIVKQGSIAPFRDLAKAMANEIVAQIEGGGFSVQLSAYDQYGKTPLFEGLQVIGPHEAGEADFDSFRQKKVYDIDWCADKDEMVDFAPPKEAYVDASLTDEEIYSDLEERYGLPVNGFLSEV